MTVIAGPMPCKGCGTPMVLVRLHGMLVLLERATGRPHRCQRVAA